MRGHIVVGVLFAGISVALSAGEDPASQASQAMTGADRAFVQAVTNTDRPPLEKILDADFTWTDLDGRTRTKAQVLRDLPKRAIANEQNAQLKQYTYGELGDAPSFAPGAGKDC